MTIPVKPPRFPDPPLEYDQVYMNNLIKTLEVFVRELNNPGLLQGTTVNLSSLAAGGYGLRNGDLFHTDGDVYIVRAKDIYFAAVGAATGAVGIVTVSTP